VYFKDRIGRGGGVCIYVRNYYRSYMPNIDVFGADGCEQVWCIISCGCEKVLCGAIYRPPGYKASACNTAILNSMRRAASSNFDGVLICGDFNHPAVSWTEDGSPFIDEQSESNSVSAEFVDGVQSLNLVQMVRLPTFIGAEGVLTKTIIDLIFADMNQRISSVSHEEPLHIKVQAHHVLSFQYSFSPTIHQNSIVVAKPCYRKGNYMGLSKYFDEFQNSWDVSFAGVDINKCLDLFLDIYNKGITDFVPMSNVNIPKNNCPWQSVYLKKLIYDKKKIFKDMKRSRHNQINSLLVEKYKTLNKLVSKTCREELLAYEERIASCSVTNPKVFHQFINNKTVIRDSIRALVDKNDKVITDPKLICDELNDWFFSVFRKEDCDNMPTCPAPSSLCGKILVDPIDIEVRLSKLDGNKSTGPDGIHPFVLKRCALSLSYPICLLCIKSLESGVVPDVWKVANITPVFKSGNKLQPTNYRGISLTSVLSKFTERIIVDHVMAYISKFNLISRHQHGFMPKLSTVTNLLEYVDIVSNGLNHGNSVDVIYLDFAKAFDRVPHQRLILKLRSIGITGPLLSWCESFLQNRKQRVVMGEYVGEWKDIFSGVPQGSVIGPLFFVIYLNDLILSLSITAKVYADDSKLISINNKNDNTQQLIMQENLNLIYEWTVDWKVFLNELKCMVLHLGTLRQLENKYKYYINGTEVMETLVEKDLGIMVTGDLQWDRHIVKLCSSVNFYAKLVFKSFDFKSVSIIRSIYTSLIRPKLEYATVIWSPKLERHKELVEKVQHRCTKFGPLANLSYHERLVQLGLTTLEVRRKRGDLIQMYKYAKGIDRIQFVNPPVFRKNITRSHGFQFDGVDRVSMLHRARKYYFLNRVVNDWNKLPPEVLEATSVDDFKKKLDKLDQFKFGCFDSNNVPVVKTGA
jgi:hypothetical protein